MPRSAPHIYIFTDVAPDLTIGDWRSGRRAVAKARFAVQLLRAARRGEVHVFFPPARRPPAA
jgi:hypothetical protein